MRPPLHWGVLALAAFTPALADPCPPPNATNDNCVEISIPAGATAADIVTTIENNWNGGDFECDSAIFVALPYSFLVVRIQGQTTSLVFRYVLLTGPWGILTPHTLRIDLPAQRDLLPFDAFASFGGGSEVQLGVGSNVFSTAGGDIDIQVSGYSYSASSTGASFRVPALGARTGIAAVVALLAAGVVLLLLRPPT